jgi:hypothetical protein
MCYTVSMQTTSKPVTVPMTFKKSTKGTHVYDAPDGAVTQVYIQKSALGDNPPQNITLTIEAA